MTIPRVLVVAGSDSGGGAGIQADIKTITMLGGHALTAVTAVTAQNTLGVRRVDVLPADAVVSQIDAVVSDIGVDAVKIGMLGSPEIVRAVADRLERENMRAIPLVFDPVMVATTGARLASAETVAGFARLMARATATTPNLDELATLAGRDLSDEPAIAQAAAHLIEDRGSGAILATGVRVPGGRIRSSDGTERSTDDLLFDLLFEAGDDGWRETAWHAPRIDTRHDHGTGCTLASAIAVGLAEGRPLSDAIERARAYVRAALLAAPGLGGGHGPMGHGLGATHFSIPVA